MNQILTMEVDPLLKLSLIEENIRKKKFVAPVPHRKTLVGWIEEGTWLGEKRKDGWHVRQSSFVAWAKALQEPQTV